MAAMEAMSSWRAYLGEVDEGDLPALVVHRLGSRACLKGLDVFGEFGEFGRNASDERVLFDPGGPGGYRLMSALCGISGLGGVSHGPLEKPVGLVGPHPPDQSPAGPDDLGGLRRRRLRRRCCE